jgi:hypothetical protein
LEESIVRLHLADRVGHPIGPHEREVSTAPSVVLHPPVDVGRAS